MKADKQEPAKHVDTRAADIKAREASEKTMPILKGVEKKAEQTLEQDAPQARKVAGNEPTQSRRDVKPDSDSQPHA
jgi:hypothetical protein